MINKQHAIIIGAGFGGLSTACYLAKAGYKVTVIEKNERVGGRANLFEAEGYSFDMGPSWYLMPDVFEHFFSIMGEKVEDHLDLRKLDPSYRIFFKNTDQIVNIHPGTEANKETFEMLEPGSYERFLDYLKRSKYQYEVAIGDFMYKNYSSVLDFFNLRMAIEGSKLSVFSKMDSYVKKFFRTPEMQKIMQYTLVFLGSSPYNTPALYNIMTHIDFNMGVYYPMGGMHQVALAVGNVAKKHGVTFVMNTPVAAINVNEENLATGVTLENGEVMEADLVVSNADRWFTETHLLEEQHREYKPKYWEKRAMAPSGLVLYLGVDGAVPEIKHHTLVFAEDWEEGFGQIFDRPQWPTDPSFYICNPSKTDPNVAPEGKENLFVLVPIAPDLDYTDESLRAYEDKILEEIEHHCGIPNFRERIEYRKSFSVKDFKEVYNSYKGTALGLAHTMMQTAAFRPDTVSKKVKNLYYAGGSTNPGNGVPICLISGELVYKRLIGDTSGRPLERI